MKAAVFITTIRLRVPDHAEVEGLEAVARGINITILNRVATTPDSMEVNTVFSNVKKIGPEDPLYIAEPKEK